MATPIASETYSRCKVCGYLLRAIQTGNRLIWWHEYNESVTCPPAERGA